MQLRDLGEFGLIRRIAPLFDSGASDVLGIGDDCAILPGAGDTVTLVTTDLLIEDVHFLRARIPPRHLGRKSLAVNVSDVASMGGAPTACFLSVGLPAGLEVDWLDEFFLGIKEMGDETGCPLLGGDTTKSPKGIVINIAVLGRVPRANVKLRSGARAGDVLAVTGPLGDSGAGLRLLLENKPLDLKDAQLLVESHHNPRPHLEEGRWLAARSGVTAMMDVSDGIDSDLQHILERSAVGGALIDIDALPCSDPMRRLCALYGWSVEETAAAAGEDYCLLCAIAPEQFHKIAHDFSARFGRPLSRIGALTTSGGLHYVKDGKPFHLKKHGFDHFKAGA